MRNLGLNGIHYVAVLKCEIPKMVSNCPDRHYLSFWSRNITCLSIENTLAALRNAPRGNGKGRKEVLWFDFVIEEQRAPARRSELTRTKKTSNHIRSSFDTLKRVPLCWIPFLHLHLHHLLSQKDVVRCRRRCCCSRPAHRQCSPYEACPGYYGYVICLRFELLVIFFGY